MRCACYRRVQVARSGSRRSVRASRAAPSWSIVSSRCPSADSHAPVRPSTFGQLGKAVRPAATSRAMRPHWWSAPSARLDTKLTDVTSAVMRQHRHRLFPALRQVRQAETASGVSCPLWYALSSHHSAAVTSSCPIDAFLRSQSGRPPPLMTARGIVLLLLLDRLIARKPSIAAPATSSAPCQPALATSPTDRFVFGRSCSPDLPCHCIIRRRRKSHTWRRRTSRGRPCSSHGSKEVAPLRQVFDSDAAYVAAGQRAGALTFGVVGADVRGAGRVATSCVVERQVAVGVQVAVAQPAAGRVVAVWFAVGGVAANHAPFVEATQFIAHAALPEFMMQPVEGLPGQADAGAPSGSSSCRTL